MFYHEKSISYGTVYSGGGGGGGELLTLTSISSEIQEILKTSHQKGNKLLEAFKGFLQNKNVK